MDLQLKGEFEDHSLLAIEGDLTESSMIENTLDTVTKNWGGLDIVVGNIGTGSGKPGWQQEEEEWARLFNLNFFSSVRLAQAAIPYMQVSGGSIILVSSIVGIEATPAPLPYSAAKAALINYGKNLSRAVAEHKIRVNTIAPGNVLFPGGTWEKHLANRRESVEAYITAEVPMNRFGTPQEISNIVVFLASPAANFVTGGCYVVDGGQTRKP
ncbi:MAG: SDR family oxidoreductase [Terriglobales bacterium]